MQRTKTVLFTCLLAICIASGVIANAQIPESINYQGYLTDSDGQALVESVVVEFSIYSVDTGGAPLWSEFKDIFPEQGLFSTSFGDALNPFPGSLFNTPLFLGVKVGTDPEMIPRTPFTSSAYSNKAKDAETVGGFSPFQLDQSSDVASLSSTLSNTNNNVNALTGDVGVNQSAISQLQGDIGIAEADISQLQADLTTTNSDVITIENTLPTLQARVSSSCVSGSSIRQIFSGGTVTCETDDAGPWSFNGSAYLASGTRIGVGTTAPAASIQIDSPVGTDPFRARVQSSTKLRVHQNGSVSVGTSSAGTDNGLYVAGFTGLGTTAATTKLDVTDINWQVQLDNNGAGGGDWYLGASATAWNVGGGKFLIGASTNSSNAALAIDANNNIGISTTSPSTRLHIGSGSDVAASGGGYLMMGSDTSSNIAIDNNEIMARNNGVATTLSLNAEGGEVRLNSAGTRDADALEVRGKVHFDNGQSSGMRISNYGSGTTSATFEPTIYEAGLVGNPVLPFWRVYSREYYAQSPTQYKSYSDRSLKKNIKPIGNALDIVNQLEGVRYEQLNHPFNKNPRDYGAEDKFVQENQLGFIAQDLEKALPQLVTTEQSSGLKTVAYMGVIPVLVEAIKEQQLQLDAQRAELDELKSRLQ